jgi:hypothetical protein
MVGLGNTIYRVHALLYSKRTHGAYVSVTVGGVELCNKGMKW